MFCRSLFDPLSIFAWYYLSFFDWWILITHLVFLSISCIAPSSVLSNFYLHLTDILYSDNVERWLHVTSVISWWNQCVLFLWKQSLIYLCLTLSQTRLYLRNLCLFAHSGSSKYYVVFLFCFYSSMLPVSLDCPFLIVSSVSSNVYILSFMWRHMTPSIEGLTIRWQIK